MSNHIRHRLFIIMFFIFQYQFTSAQLWTWMNGGNGSSSVAPVPAVYGTQGAASSTNYPGATTNPSTWQDSNGNFWMFGGSGSFSASAANNDLWKYSISTNEWTWMHGSATASNVGVYGTQGVSSTTNMPGSRFGATSWVDQSGNFWLFGGFGYTPAGFGQLSDLWKYNPVNNEWTWVNGSSSASQYGVYGTLGVSSPSVYPGARLCYNKWSDASGNLWLFGGQGYASSGSFGYLKDLWKYNIALNQWTWMGGSNAVNQAGQYGTQSVASSTNIPGGRNGSAVWKDASGYVWLYGGNGYSSSTSSSGTLSDLWRYDMTTNQWMWVKGGTGLNSTGLYGTLGVGNATTSPGGHALSAVWPEVNGDLYMFGGSGQNANSGYVHLNDIWKYSVANNVWTWVNGNSQSPQAGVYGLQGIASTQNMAGSKQAMGAFKDASNNLWTFGGSGSVLSSSFVVVNELWKYELCSTPAIPVNTTTAAKQNICAGNNTTLTVLSDAPVTWYTSLTGNTSLGTGSTLSTPALAAGNYTYFAEAKLCNASASRAMLVVTVTPNPTLSVNNGSICSGETFTLNPAGAASYTYSGGTSIVSPANTSTYQITGTSSFGCPATNSVVATVSVNASPTLIIAGSATLCFGSVVTLTATGAASYSWTGGVVTNTFTDAPTVNTIYVVSGLNQLGCTSTLNYAVTVYSLPVISVTDGTICSGNSFTIHPTGAANYSFSGGNQVVSPLITSTYTLTGSSANGCPSSNSVVATVVVNALPVFTLSGNSSVCKGTPVTLLVNGSSLSYTWSNGSNANLVVFTPTASTGYTVTVTGTNGCRDSASKFVTVYPLPVVTANASSTTICEGGSLLLFGSGATTYSWTSGITDGIAFTPSVSSTYTVTGLDLNSCENSASISIMVAASPTVIITSNSATVCVGEIIYLTATGASSYSWSGGESGAVVQLAPSTSMSYSVEGTDANTCKGSASILIEVDACTGLSKEKHALNFKVFPNPANGEFYVQSYNTQKLYSLRLYNSLGQLIHSKEYCVDAAVLNMDTYPAGIYTLIINEGEGVERIKIIKN